MTRVRVRSKGVSSPNRNLSKIIDRGDRRSEVAIYLKEDPRTVVGLIYRLSGDPLRALILIGLVAALTGIVALLLSVINPLNMLGPMVGVAGGGVMLIGLILRQALRSRRK